MRTHLKGAFMGAQEHSKILRLITPAKISSVNGKLSLIGSGLFSFITPSFVNTYDGHVIEATRKTTIDEHIVLIPNTLKRVFEELSRGPRNFAFTEHQIVELILSNSFWMEQVTTYFFFKYRGHIVPASIFWNNGFGLEVYTKGVEDETTILPIGARVITPWEE